MSAASRRGPRGAAGAAGADGAAGAAGAPGPAPAGTGVVSVRGGVLVDPARPLSIGGAAGPAVGIGSAESVLSAATPTPPAQPTFVPGSSVVVMLYPVATPVASQVIISHLDPAAARGWIVLVGDNAGDRSALGLYLAGVATAPTQVLASATWAGALNVAHCVAISWLVDKSIRYSWDDVGVVVIGALGGVYVPPIAGDVMDLGARVGVSNLISAQIVAARTYSTVLSDADLVLATNAAARAAWQIPTLTGTVTLDTHASDFAAGRSRITGGHHLWQRPGGAVYAR